MAEKYNLDITITLDIPAGGDYDLILYDEQGNEVGVGWENGKGGKSVYVPDWDMVSGGYMVKVQPRSGMRKRFEGEKEEYRMELSRLPSEEFYIIYPQLIEMHSYAWVWQKRLHEGWEELPEKQAGKAAWEKSAASYTEQLEQAYIIEQKRKQEYEQKA